MDRQGSDWPYAANDGSAFGYFWNKFLDTSGDDGVNFTKAAGLLTDITTSGDAFIPITQEWAVTNLLDHLLTELLMVAL